MKATIRCENWEDEDTGKWIQFVEYCGILKNAYKEVLDAGGTLPVKDENGKVIGKVVGIIEGEGDEFSVNVLLDNGVEINFE